MESAALNILYGVVGSLLAVGAITFAARTRVAVALLGASYELAKRIRSGGITKFHLSRDDYGRTLRTYLEGAKDSIGIVSVSLKQTHDEGNLLDLFRQRLAQNASFRINISLLAPGGDAVRCAARSLKQDHGELSTTARKFSIGRAS